MVGRYIEIKGMSHRFRVEYGGAEVWACVPVREVTTLLLPGDERRLRLKGKVGGNYNAELLPF